MTDDELREFQVRPFQPFRIWLSGGELVDITREFQIAVMPKQFAAAVNEKLKFFPLSRVERVERVLPVQST